MELRFDGNIDDAFQMGRFEDLLCCVLLS